MLQQIIVFIIFIAAVIYVGRLLFRSFFVKSDCATGCGKCSAIDFDKIEKQLKQKGI